MRKIVFFILLCNCLNGFSQNAELIYKNVVNSTVTIETEEKLGSGFFIGNNLIVTNYHVIKGSKQAFYYQNNSPRKNLIEGYVSVDRFNDLVILKVNGLNKQPLKFSSVSPKIGQSIYVIGSPKGLPATISDGIISGLRDFDSKRLIQISAPISSGSSGGPVLNSQGLLIGVSVSQLAEGQNLNFAIPASYLKILIDEIDSINELKYLDVDENLIVEIESKKEFETVKIGSTIWMQNNLNVDRFRNGDLIPEAKSEYEWEKAGKDGTPAWCYYNNFNSKFGEKYGKLYNWHAVADSRGLAPLGWHISTEEDWAKLNLDLGGKFVGYEIKTNNEWEKGQGGNTSGFSAYPSGARWADLEFRNYGTASYWWTTNELNFINAAFILLTMNSHDILNKIGDKKWGMSVRCVKNR